MFGFDILSLPCRLREGQVARLSAIGPPALHSALRSLTLSGHWLSKDIQQNMPVVLPVTVKTVKS